MADSGDAATVPLPGGDADDFGIATEPAAGAATDSWSNDVDATSVMADAGVDSWGAAGGGAEPSVFNDASGVGVGWGGGGADAEPAADTNGGGAAAWGGGGSGADSTINHDGDGGSSGGGFDNNEREPCNPSKLPPKPVDQTCPFDPNEHVQEWLWERVHRQQAEINVPDRFELFLLGDGEKKITETIDTRECLSRSGGVQDD